ncbi:MAG: hypothetical protein WC372_06255 [Candidatus Neomarinimicrobiota bacterium]|jgi:hypothetical protein|nr:hypothetical protein [Candidatus Neomarinimicrobiota bacterium]MDD3966308.1 hypothetical protein [Candidatus Neomarinimicrobiota bacterium]MDX9779672.1 hypothetical protein [bacterium]
MILFFRILFALLLLLPALAADTLKIAPCDAAMIGDLGDIYTLNRSTRTLYRYRGDRELNRFSESGFGKSVNLQDPLRPLVPEADKILLLDAAANRVISWDRFLNLHSVTPLPEGIVSPAEFTVNAEYDWLIYDAFRQEIYQIRPGEHFLQRWGDRSVNGEIRLYTVDEHIMVFLKDRAVLRYCGHNGKTLAEYLLPDSLNIQDLIPMNAQLTGLICREGVYIWEPQGASCRLLSDLPDVIHIRYDNKHITLINRHGTIVIFPLSS